MIIELNEKTIEAIFKTVLVTLGSGLIAGVAYIVTTLHDVENKQDLIDYKLDQISFVLQDIYENKKDVKMYPPWMPKYKMLKANSDELTIETISSEPINVKTIDEVK